MVDVALFNVVVMGLAFMSMFGAFQTSTFIEGTVLHSNHTPNLDTANGDGIAFTSVAIIYFVFAFANAIAPASVGYLGARRGMFVGAIPYCLFIACILYPYLFTLYTCSALLGIGAAVLWTAQGEYLTNNSTDQTMSRNTGIFWALLQSSLVVGNLTVYFILGNTTDIDNSLRYLVYGVLTGAATVGCVLLLFLRQPPSLEYSLTLSTQSTKKAIPGPVEATLAALRLLKTREMILLAICFTYTGLELTFFSGVYGTMIGNMDNLKGLTNGHFQKDMVALGGVIVGAGEILGGLTFGILGSRTIKYGRDPVVIVGMLIHLATFYLCYLNFLPSSPYQTVTPEELLADKNRLFSPSVAVAQVCAFTLGLGDSMFNTQIYGIIAALYSEDSAPAFALFKFFQSLFSGVAFIYSSHLQLQYQLAILAVMAIFGTWSFVAVEWSLKRKRAGYQPIQ